MIVCHRYRFIFIKTRKTAGTSMEIALSRYCDKGDIVTPIAPVDEVTRRKMGYQGPVNYGIPFRSYSLSHWKKWLLKGERKKRFHNHTPGPRVRELLSPEIWNTYHKFCFERNPWDKLVSAYFWEKSRSDGLRWEEFINDPGRWRIYREFRSYADERGPILDFVGKYETITDDLAAVAGRLGLPDFPELPTAKSSQRENTYSYTTFYTREQKELVEREFADEIRLLGYRFEGS